MGEQPDKEGRTDRRLDPLSFASALPLNIFPPPTALENRRDTLRDQLKNLEGECSGLKEEKRRLEMFKNSVVQSFHTYPVSRQTSQAAFTSFSYPAQFSRDSKDVIFLKTAEQRLNASAVRGGFLC